MHKATYSSAHLVHAHGAAVVEVDLEAVVGGGSSPLNGVGPVKSRIHANQTSFVAS